MAMRKISSFTEDHFQRSHLELRILKGGRTDTQVMNGEAFSDKKSQLRKQVYQSLKKLHYTNYNHISYTFQNCISFEYPVAINTLVFVHP